MADVQSPPAPLSQGVGYGVVVGLGVAFALGMAWTTRALKKVFGEDSNKTETFMVANRSVGTGLTASAVISSWTYPTALLAAPFLTYWHGVGQPIWWANGQSVMICCFAYLAIQAKLKVPNAHTLLEIIKVRYGHAAHLLWILMNLMNNIFNSTSMLVGTSTAVSSLTGMNIYAATYLLPLGVGIYTYFGGLRATYLTDYVHTFIYMIILVWFCLKVITVSEIGSIGALYDLLLKLPEEGTVEGNYKGSYLTMTSKNSIFFGIIHILTNFAVVCVDTGFWQKGFSAEITSAVPGYIIGGNAYFAVPFTTGTIVGLGMYLFVAVLFLVRTVFNIPGALVLEQTPIWPTYPRRMTDAEVGGGLVLPYTAAAVAGKGGAAAILLVLFMAATSLASAQLIAMSSIFSVNIYGTYINKKPTDKDLIRWSHIGVVVAMLFISTFSTIMHKAGIDLNWLLYMIGPVLCPGFFPTVFTILWRKQSRLAAIGSALTGAVCGFAVWFGVAYAMYGEISIATTGETMPCLYATITSFFVPLPVSVVLSYIRPDSFDWKTFLQIERIGDGKNSESHFDPDEYYTPERVSYMERMSRVAMWWGIATFLGQIALWPLPMYGARHIMSKGLFTAWVVVGLIWLFCTLLIANFYPLIDGGFVKIGQVVQWIRGVRPAVEINSETDDNVVSATTSGADVTKVPAVVLTSTGEK